MFEVAPSGRCGTRILVSSSPRHSRKSFASSTWIYVVTRLERGLLHSHEQREGVNTLARLKQELRNDDKGTYLVTTATGSHYVLDLNARTVSRQMAATAPRLDYLQAGFSKLRRDGESVELHMIEHCVIGESAHYWIQVREDHVVTLRMTSPVVRIEELAPIDDE